ncbi:MAG: hypothetical protein GY733_07225 [bacterium]|nr:hypothetical protein [bacterium]
MSTESGSRRHGDRFSRICLIVTTLVLYPRLYFGLAFFDEPYYLALPYGFSLGHRPFIDENAVHQLAGLLTWPAIETYLAVTGTTDGMVLYSRHLYFAVAIATALLLRVTWRALLGERTANWLAAVMLAYVPLCLFALSYNTFMSLGLLAGTSCLARACLPGRRALTIAAGTVCLAVASFAYPPVIPAAAIALGLGIWATVHLCSPEERRPVWIAAVTAALVSGSLGIALLLALDFPDAIDRMLEFSRAQNAQGGGGAKLWAVWLELRFQGALLLTLGAAISLGVFAISRDRAIWWAAALTAPVLFGASLLYRPFHAPFTTVPFVLAILGLAAPWVLLSQRHEFGRQRLLALGVVVATSVLAGATILWSSANGLRNLALGLTPAALVTLGVLTHRIETRSKDPRSVSPASALVVSLLCFQLVQSWSHAYREFVPTQLDTRVAAGPWAGLWTTSRKVEFLDELSRDLAATRGDGQSILFFDYFPAGYLMSDLLPATPGLWMFPVSRIFQGTTALRDVYAARLKARGALPDLVVRMRCIPANPFTTLPGYAADPVIALFGAGEHEIAIDRPCYRILTRPAEAPQ